MIKITGPGMGFFLLGGATGCRVSSHIRGAFSSAPSGFDLEVLDVLGKSSSSLFSGLDDLRSDLVVAVVAAACCCCCCLYSR